MASPKASRITEMGLNTKELELLAAAWISCGDTVPKPNYAFMADFCGYKNGGSASVMFGHVRRKLKEIADREGTTNSDDATATPKKTPKKTPVSTKKRAGMGDESDGTPAKRGRKKKEPVKKAAASPSHVSHRGDDEDAAGEPDEELNVSANDEIYKSLDKYLYKPEVNDVKSEPVEF